MYIGKIPTVGNFQICDTITVVDAQAAYTMQVDTVDVSPESANHMIVSLNGVIQKPTDAYTVSGSTITFASALETGDVIDFIQILGNVLDLGVPSDNTVTTAKLADSSVSLAKLTATGTKDATTFLRGDNTFASAGSPSIDDNGNATAITINSSEQVEFTAGTVSLPAITTTGDVNTGIFFPAADTIAFAESGAETMRIDTVGNTYGNGRVLINTTVPGGTSDGQLYVTQNGEHGRVPLALNNTASGGASHDIQHFYRNNTLTGKITNSSSATAYVTSSDYRLKENVVAMDNATTRLKQLQPKRFNFIADADTTVDGFIAHEVSSIVPEAVSGTKDAVLTWKSGEELPEGVSVGDNKLDADGNTIIDSQGIDQSKLVPLLVKTIQELEARITTLENA
jgi:hypothetical protein